MIHHLLVRPNGFSRARAFRRSATPLLCCLACLLPAFPSAFGQRSAGNPAYVAAASSSLPEAPTPQGDLRPASGQQTTATEAAEVTLRGMPRRVLSDLGGIATSPAHIQRHDMVWLLPLAGATAAGIATDHEVMARQVTHDRSTNNTSIDVSNGFVGGMIAAPVVLFGFGELRNHPRATESGLLSAESVIDALIAQLGIKAVTRRERPKYDNAHGLFFNHNAAAIDSSFPSAHSIAAWSIAGSLATEYPSKWADAGLYTMAAGVSVTRVLGQQHFPTDVLVGSAAGWLIGHYVVRSYQHKHPRLANLP